MKTIVKPLSKDKNLNGSLLIPASKSHTIRALLIAALAKGESLVINPLESKDARSCLKAIELFGAKVTEISGAQWGCERAFKIIGVGDKKSGILVEPAVDVVDTGNSGTTLYLAASIAALNSGYTVFTGDHQIRNRPIQNLVKALNDLGAEAFTTKNNGKAPVVIRGPIKGGSTTIECPTSQFLSSLLIALPLADHDTTINITLLHEQPYAEMTLRWLDEQNIKYNNVDDAWKTFHIKGGQAYSSFEKVVPADFSSATFFACLAAINKSKIVLRGLDMNDSQGDKKVFHILKDMGCVVRYDEKDSQSGIEVIGPGNKDNPNQSLKGGVFDLNDIPDALPALSVTSCFASGPVSLVNVPQARLKETDRIAVMCKELTKMGAKISERPDGLEISPSTLKGTEVEGHDDHRVVMSLAFGALMAEGQTTISGSEAASVTYPAYFAELERLGADLSHKDV